MPGACFSANCLSTSIVSGFVPLILHSFPTATPAETRPRLLDFVLNSCGCHNHLPCLTCPRMFRMSHTPTHAKAMATPRTLGSRPLPPTQMPGTLQCRKARSGVGLPPWKFRKMSTKIFLEHYLILNSCRRLFAQCHRGSLPPSLGMAPYNDVIKWATDNLDSQARQIFLEYVEELAPCFSRTRCAGLPRPSRLETKWPAKPKTWPHTSSTMERAHSGLLHDKLPYFFRGKGRDTLVQHPLTAAKGKVSHLALIPKAPSAGFAD